MKEWSTAARGNLEKVNLDGCRRCGRVYVSGKNSNRIGVGQGWYDLTDLTFVQGPNNRGQDIVLRVRGRFSQMLTGGLKTCDVCRRKPE